MRNNNAMSRQSPELFKSRSASQEFLFSRPQGAPSAVDQRQPAPTNLRARQNGPTVSAGEAGTLDRQGLVDAIDTAFASVNKLCVVMLQFETPMDAPDADKQPASAPNTPDPGIVDTVCREIDGIWARIDERRTALAVPHFDIQDGRRMAQRIQQHYTAIGTPPITAGVAVYPTANYTRSQSVDNAGKALVHAGFFGPGSVTCFDAISLNISGDRLYQEGDIQGAVDEFKQGLLMDPTEANLHNSLGVCYGVLGDTQKALDAFDAAMWLAPDNVMAVYNKGYILLQLGHYEKAQEALLQADAIEGDVFEVVFHLGQLFMRMNAAEKARPYLEASTRANNRYGPAFRLLGACLDELNLGKEAIQAYKSAVKINPADALALSALGRLYTERGESLDVAAVMCEQSVQLDPDNGLFHHRLGLVYLSRGKLDHALAEFELATALGHDSRAHIEKTQDLMMAAQAS
jgi:tetratricopeptide (TPR) repeat protein